MSYWGNHASLYKTLPPEGIQALERAVRFQVRGDYAESSKSFTLLDESVSRLPVAAIEHALLYDRMGLFQEQLKLLKAIEHPSTEQIRELGANEWDLVGQLRASAELWANGRLEHALSQACLMARRLKRKGANTFTDIEVSHPHSFSSLYS